MHLLLDNAVVMSKNVKHDYNIAVNRQSEKSIILYISYFQYQIEMEVTISPI